LLEPAAPLHEGASRLQPSRRGARTRPARHQRRVPDDARRPTRPRGGTAMNDSILTVQNLDVTYGHGRNAFTAVQDISFSIARGSTLGLVGESGSGKSTVGRAILGLATPTSGSITFEGSDITHASRKRRRELASELQVVFQDPRSSL